MAISQSKFVNIESTRLSSGDPIFGFNALLVCSGDKNNAEGAVVEHGVYYTNAELLTSLGEKMTENAKDAAKKFFSVSNGRAKLLITIATNSGTVDDAIAAVTDNWLVAFSGDYQKTTDNKLSDFVSAVKGAGGIPIAGVTETTHAAAISALTSYSSDDKCILFAGKEAGDVACIPAILASTNYQNSIKQYCFAACSGVDAFCTTDDAFDALVAAHINFVGEVKSFGGSMQFLMMGVNSKGDDLVSYFGEIWLEETVKSNIMRMFTSGVVTVATGKASVEMQIAIAMSVANANGVMVKGKSFSEEEKADIIQIAGDDTAPDTISLDGAWYRANVVKYGAQYNVSYVLIYADATGVKYVTGKHVLV